MIRINMKSKNQSGFSYPVTRPITVPYFTPVIIALGLIFTAFITVLAVIGSGYESVTQLSASFNNTPTHWYSALHLPTLLLPISQCTSSIIKVGESTHLPL
jgi:hypothetical protein